MSLRKFSYMRGIYECGNQGFEDLEDQENSARTAHMLAKKAKQNPNMTLKSCRKVKPAQE